MLREINGPDKNIADRGNTRALKNAVVRHHQSNPHVSMEAAFEYIMLNSATFRALSDVCIEKARRYLALPETDDKIKKASSEKLEDIFTGLNEALQDLADSSQPLVLIPFGLPESEGATPIGITEYDLAHREIPRLSTHDLWEFIKLVSVSKSDSETLGNTFGRVRRETDKFFKMNPIDIHDAWTQLTEMQGNKPKPGTTVVHAERVVVDNKKMIKILEFENVQLLSDLPNKYTANTPVYCWFRSGIELKYYDAPSTIHQNVLPSDTLSLKEFGQMIKTMKEAGVRLTNINKTAKLEKGHSGKFTVSI